MRTGLAVLFIAAAAALAVGLFQMTTVIDGTAISNKMLAAGKDKGMTAAHCPDRIPIDHYGAVYRCHIVARDGSTADFEVILDRDGVVAPPKVLAQTAPTQRP